ncbi:MAG: hypothetical protein KTR25_19855 [Myxococcales bacterium]|nr:hypothetical protein [Myxococcales bacterium]
MHPWRGRSRPSQQDLPIRDPEAVLGERHPQMIACEAFLGRPVRQFRGVRPNGDDARLNHPWARAWSRHMANLPELAGVISEANALVENGEVWHLEIDQGEARTEVRTIVLTDQLYAQQLIIEPLSRETEAKLIDICRGRVHLTEQLITGLLPVEVFQQLIAPDSGLFPTIDVLQSNCSCGEPKPCIHIAAGLLGIAYRLNERPGRLFALRKTKPEVLKGLLPPGLSRPPPPIEEQIPGDQIPVVFDLRLDRGEYETELAAAVQATSNPLEQCDEKSKAETKADEQTPTLTPATPPAPPPRPRANVGQQSWLDDDWDDDDDDDDDDAADIDTEVFGGSGPSPSPVSIATSGEGADVLEIGRADLLDLGLPSHRIQRWLAEGTLLRTDKRGQYQLTPDAWAAIEPLLPE